MPIAVDPRRTYWLNLESDSDLPEEIRPSFQYRFLTYAEAIEFNEILNDFMGMGKKIKTAKNKFFEKEADVIADRLIQAAGRKLVGWKNMPGPDGNPLPFDPGSLKKICTLVEIVELINRQTMHQALDFEDKKKLSLLQDLGPESSAPTVGVQENADSPSAGPNP